MHKGTLKNARNDSKGVQGLLEKITERTNLILGIFGVVLFVVFFFYNFIIPQTPGRMTRSTADLIPDLPLWSFITSLPLPIPQNSYLAAALLVTFALMAFTLYGLAIFLCWRSKFQLKTLFVIIITGLAFFQLSAWALPNVNTDIFNYMLRGRVGAVYEANPYYVIADEFPEDPIYPYASHKYTAKPGGKLPTWMSINIFLAKICGDDVISNLLVYRFAFFLFNSITLLFIGLILRRIKHDFVLPGLVIYAWNPIIVMFGQSKTDTVMVFFLAMAILFFVYHRENLAVVALALSIFVKLITFPLIVVHWLGALKVKNWRRLFAVSLLFVLTALVVYSPYLESPALFLNHIGYMDGAGTSAPNMVRSILRIGFILVILWFGLTQNGSIQRLLFGWTMVMLYFSLFLTAFSLSWYLMSLIVLVSMVPDWRISLLTVVISFSAFLFNSWYSTFTDTFYVHEIFSLPTFVVYLLLPTIAAVLISALILWQKFRVRDGRKAIPQSQMIKTVSEKVLMLNFNATVSGTEKEQSNMLRILTYHRVANAHDSTSTDPRLISATPEEFQKQMAYLSENYNVISVTELLDCVQNGSQLPIRSVLITFDDAYKDFKEHAWPILKSYHMPVTLFVPTGYPDNPEKAFWWDRLYCAFTNTTASELRLSPVGSLSWSNTAERLESLKKTQNHIKTLRHSDAMELVEKICVKLESKSSWPKNLSCILSWEGLQQLSQEGVTLGAHTRTHPILTQMSKEEIRDEILGSQDDLLREIGSAYPILAYPNGSHDERVLEMVKQGGFKLGFNGPGAHNVLGKTDSLRLRRINITRRTNLQIFQVRLLRLGSYIDLWRYRNRVA